MNNATDQMMQSVSSAKSSADNALKLFTQRTRTIRQKSRSHIDLFGGTALTQVSDIASDIRRAGDDRYASLQALISLLDEECRPLLKENPSAKAVKAVVDLIVRLNNESDFCFDISASLNGDGLGDVATSGYLPSIECKAIQQYWETKYSMMPEAIEEEKRKKELAKKRAEEEARIRTAREKKQQAEAAELEIARKQSQEKYDAEISALKIALDNEYENHLAQAKETITLEFEAIERRKNSLISEQTTLNGELQALGFFSFGEKNKTKKRLLEIERELSEFGQKAKNLNDRLNQQEEHLRYERTRKLDHATTEIQKKYPELFNTRPVASSTMSKEKLQIVNVILNTMQPGALYTVSDIVEGFPFPTAVGNQRITSLLTQLVREGQLERVVERRISYFKLP